MMVIRSGAYHIILWVRQEVILKGFISCGISDIGLYFLRRRGSTIFFCGERVQVVKDCFLEVP